MTLTTDLSQVVQVDFGVIREQEGNQVVHLVPPDPQVQEALVEMVQATWERMESLGEGEEYSPAEKYGTTEHLILPLGDEMATFVRELHEAANVPEDANAFRDPAELVSYFARLKDEEGHRITALRRATRFKGVVKSRLIHVVTNTVRMVEDDVFRLDHDFDMLADGVTLHILRPSGFEYAGQLQEKVLEAVSGNIGVLEGELDFVDLSPVEEYASSHPRAARYLASIRSNELAGNVGKAQLKQMCEATGVHVAEEGGKLVVEEGDVLGFLEVLDRRRYEVSLVEGEPERFRASARSRLP